MNIEFVIPLVVPMLITGIKIVVPKIPKYWLPIAAPILGSVIEVLGYLDGQPGISVIRGALLGAAGVCVREMYDQVRKSRIGKARAKSSVVFIILLLSVLSLPSCARFSTKQTDVSYEKGSPSRQVTTRVAAWTFFSARAQLATSAANQTDKSQGAKLGGLSGEGGVNAALVDAAVKAAVGAAISAAGK